MIKKNKELSIDSFYNTPTTVTPYHHNIRIQCFIGQIIPFLLQFLTNSAKHISVCYYVKVKRNFRL